MSDIRKRNGTKGTTYQVRYSSTATKSGHAYKTFNTLKEARAFREDAYARKSSRNHNSEVTTIHQAIDLWLNICEKIGRDGRECVEPETLKQYQGLGRIITDYPWEKALQEIETVDVVQFRSWLLENKSRDLSRKVLSAFHSVLIEMKQHGHISDDPASGISIRSNGRLEEFNKQKDIPSDNEIQLLLKSVEEMAEQEGRFGLCWARYKPMIYLAVFSGMRPSEYRGLTWNDVYEDRVEIRQRADKSGRIGAVKSKSGVRTIYLPKAVTKMIFDWRKICPKSDFNLVFPTDTGSAQLLSNIRRGAWNPLMKKAGLVEGVNVSGKQKLKPKYTMYTLRHYFASKLIEKGTDFKIIQETMGHSTIELTFNVYGHLLKDREEARKEIAENLAGEILGNLHGKEQTLFNA